MKIYGIFMWQVSPFMNMLMRIFVTKWSRYVCLYHTFRKLIEDETSTELVLKHMIIPVNFIILSHTLNYVIKY